MVKPHLRIAPAYDRLRLVTFGSSKLRSDYYTYRGISGALSVQEAEFMGFTARGIIIDCEMGGLSVQTYNEICIEDLLKIRDIVAKLDKRHYH